MVVRVTAIEKDGLLDQPLADDFGEKIDIFLCAAGARCEVVNSGDGIVHGCLPDCSDPEQEWGLLLRVHIRLKYNGQRS
jgi:hypothetical protein